MSSKLQYARALQDICTDLAKAIENLEPLVTAYYKRQYNVEGPTQLLDSDVESLGITADNVAAAITMGEQIVNFRDNLAVVQADYADTLAEMRRF